MKEKYLKFIKDFSSISVTQICKDQKIDRSCILRGRSSEEKTRILYDELMKQILEILPKETNKQRIIDDIIDELSYMSTSLFDNDYDIKEEKYNLLMNILKGDEK